MNHTVHPIPLNYVYIYIDIYIYKNCTLLTSDVVIWIDADTLHLGFPTSVQPPAT